MSKLFSLKKWISLTDAAVRLSSSFDEEVSEGDIVQLALDGRLLLSLRLRASHLYALRWHIRRKDEIKYEDKNVEYPSYCAEAQPKESVSSVRVPIGGEVRYSSEFCKDDEVLQLGILAVAFDRLGEGRDIVDLPITIEARDFLFWCLDVFSGDSDASDCNIDKLIIQEESGHLWQIESYEDRLLCDIELVVKTKALIALEQSFNDEPKAEDLKTKDEMNPRKEETLYRLILGMAQGGYGYNPDAKKNDVIGEIQRDLDELGLGLGERTIRNHLNAAKAYLPTKPIKT